MKLSDRDAVFLFFIAYFLGCPIYLILIQRHDHEPIEREGIETPPNE